MKLLKIFLLLFFSCASAFSQISDEWLGLWKGELLIFHAAGSDKLMSVHMELHITKTDSVNILNWRSIYKDSTKDDRKFLLRSDDVSKGKYMIDEKDGILIEANLFDNTLICRFEVAGTLLDFTYKLEGEKIIFEVITSQLLPTLTTKSTVDQVAVNSYTVTNIQRANLYRSP